MPVSVVTTQFPPSLPHLSSLSHSRDHHMADYTHSRSNDRPALELDTTSRYRDTPYSQTRAELTQQQTFESGSARPFYDPVQDSSQSSSQQSDSRQNPRTGDSNMSRRSPESARSNTSHPSLPPISHIYEYDSRPRSERQSPPSTYSARSPMSLTQDMISPYPLHNNASHPYHSVYSESSPPSSSQNTISPHDRYGQALSSRSPSQYDSQRYRETPGHTPLADMRSPLSASTSAAFSPMINTRSPIDEQQQHQFGRDRQSPPPVLPPVMAGQYQCTHEDCLDKPPFQTQYLLSSHQNVHKPDRPYYCQVADCPRSKNGKPNSGFKRKNELIRHQLVHNSPGYACPFCPDRDHKYPRPDNLQRHVKVHHTDKSKDDPELRAILAQRIDSDKAGRRRRVNSTS